MKLELSLARESILHFFDQLRKAFPSLIRLRRREDQSILVEEEMNDDQGKRWIRLEPASLRFGYYAPPSLDQVQKMAETVLEQAPFHLTFSELDYDHLELVYGFDLEYSGNHDQLIAETLFRDHPISNFLLGDEAHHTIDAQPYFGISLTPQCDLQAYVEIKSRTATYEVRTQQFESQPLSVFLTIRKYWGYSANQSLAGNYRVMTEYAEDLAANKIIPLFVNPLAQAIASRS